MSPPGCQQACAIAVLLMHIISDRLILISPLRCAIRAASVDITLPFIPLV